MNSTLSVAVLSGKGGVGKTTLSLNLAARSTRAGFKNLLMDCDMGLANLDVLLGITPERQPPGRAAGRRAVKRCALSPGAQGL